MTDVTSLVTYLGNPAKAFNSGWTHAANVWDMQILGSLIYAGCGCFSNSNPDANAGPLPVFEIDPAAGTITSRGETGTGTVNAECIDRLAVVNGILTMPDTDPVGSNAGAYSYLDTGTNLVIRRANTTPAAVHNLDAIEFDSKLWQAVSGVSGPIYQSLAAFPTTATPSWTASSPGAVAIQPDGRLFVFGGALYTHFDFACGTGSGIFWKCNSGSTTFSNQSATTWNWLTASASSPGGNGLMRRVVAFGSSLVYTVNQLVEGYPFVCLMKWDGSASPVALALPNSGEAADDIWTDGTTLYVVTHYTTGGHTVVTLRSTTDLSTWTVPYTFTPNNVTGSGYPGGEAYARSLEVVGTKIVFGMGADWNATAANIPANVGAILAYDTAGASGPGAITITAPSIAAGGSAAPPAFSGSGAISISRPSVAAGGTSVANAPSITTTARNAAADAVTALIGTSANLVIYDGTAPATVNAALSGNNVLAVLPLSSTSFGAASSGVATAATITSDTSADATGTATFFRIRKSDGTTYVMQGSVGTSGCDLNLSSVSIVATGTVSVTSLTYTQSGS